MSGRPAHDGPDTVAADRLVDCGLVVVVDGVVVVVDGVEAAAFEVEDWPETVVAAEEVVEGVVAVEPEAVWVVATDEECAVLPEATSTPSPMAPADAATPMPTVTRRTRVRARSRDRAADWDDGWRGGGCGAMAGLSGWAGLPCRDRRSCATEPSDPAES
jgi:hypothetical protein